MINSRQGSDHESDGSTQIVILTKKKIFFFLINELMDGFELVKSKSTESPS